MDDCKEHAEKDDEQDDNQQAQHDQQSDLVAIGRLLDLGPMGVRGRARMRRR